MKKNQDDKTLVGVLASRDNVDKNSDLARIFNNAAQNQKQRDILSKFRFVFTGGTYNRLFGNLETGKGARPRILETDTIDFLTETCGVISLPPMTSGGIIMLASLIVQKKVSIIWPFLTPRTTHILHPDNLALLRLADQWRVKKLINSGSVIEWIELQATRDANLNRQAFPFSLELPGSEEEIKGKMKGSVCIIPEYDEGENVTNSYSNNILAVISHDAMKERMVEFLLHYENELSSFEKILTTDGTGKLIQDVARSEALRSKVYRYHSGPMGGDIEIATEILYGRCRVVIFFVDPLHAHPHEEDIRVIFGACMINDQVRMLSNETHARDWMDTVVRGM